MSIYTIKQSKIIALTLIIIIGIFLLFSLQILFTAILAAVVIYVLFKPFYLYLSEKKKINRTVSVILVIIATIIIIIIPFASLIWMLTDKVLYYKENPAVFEKFISAIQSFIGQNFDQKTVTDVLNQAGAYAVGLLTRFLDSSLDLLLTLSMMYFFLYFMFKNSDVFESTIVKYMPFREKNSEHFALELKNMTNANVIGQGIIAFAQGLFMGIGFWIFGIPDPIFWSLICFFVSFLPVIGSAAVFVPAGIVELASGHTGSGIGVMLYGFIVVSNVDNVLRLWINKWLGDIHPLITITGIVIGIPIFGILGLVFGPFLISVFLLLVRMYEAAFINESDEKERVVEREEIS
jgi:predicted PurR-regulated permease PerM